MANILCIETATKWCSVGIAKSGIEQVCIEATSDKFIHSEKLHVFIKKAIQDFDGMIDAVAVSEGPGSYTGLRIGAAAAKGLCVALDIPLIAISSLKIIAAGARQSYPNKTYFPVIDARRMEVFGAFFDEHLQLISPTHSYIFEEGFEIDLKHTIVSGDGAEKLKEQIISFGGEVDLNTYSSVKWMFEIAEQKFVDGRFEDLILFEPKYHKNFQAGKPKKLL